MLSDQDRDTIRVVAMEIGDHISAALVAAMDRKIEHHQVICPHGRWLARSKWLAAGVILAGVAGGSALSNVVIKLLTGH